MQPKSWQDATWAMRPAPQGATDRPVHVTPRSKPLNVEPAGGRESGPGGLGGAQRARRSVLVVSYSRSGHTRYLAQEIAQQCNADLDEIEARAPRRGLFGWLRSAGEAVLRISAAIEPSRRLPQHYDLVIVGTPVWAGRMASPVRAYLQRHRGQFRRVAFFCTLGGSGQTQVPIEMARLCGRPALATLAIRSRDVAMRHHWRPVAKFVRLLKSGRRTAPPAQPMAA